MTFICPRAAGVSSSQQTVPLYVDNTLYVTSAFGRVIALDPETGKPKWSFDPKTDVSAGWGDFANRGVATWLDPKRKAGELLPAANLCRSHRCPAFCDRRSLRLGLH